MGFEKVLEPESFVKPFGPGDDTQHARRVPKDYLEGKILYYV
jgi:hypothetical protein